MGVALAAETDDSDLLALDQVKVGVAIVINPHFTYPSFWPSGPNPARFL
jgi:hypothetical protein